MKTSDSVIKVTQGHKLGASWMNEPARDSREHSYMLQGKSVEECQREARQEKSLYLKRILPWLGLGIDNIHTPDHCLS